MTYLSSMLRALNDDPWLDFLTTRITNFDCANLSTFFAQTELQQLYLLRVKLRQRSCEFLHFEEGMIGCVKRSIVESRKIPSRLFSQLVGI